MLEEGVITLPGSGFGPAGEGFFRIALTVSAERIAEGVGHLGRVLAATPRESGAPAAP